MRIFVAQKNTVLPVIQYCHSNIWKLTMIHFSIIKSWKGHLKKDLYTRIITQCCLCGYSFEEKKKYLLYLYGPDKEGFYSTSICIRTTYAENAEEDIEILDELVNEKQEQNQ